MSDSVELPKKYKTGSVEMDRQHEELILILSGIYNLLHTPHSKLKEGGMLREAMDRLKNFFHVHFKYEEDKMRHIEYEFIEKHIMEHQKFIIYINEVEFNEEIDIHKKLIEVEHFCGTYFIDHIPNYDIPLAEAMKNYEFNHRKR